MKTFEELGLQANILKAIAELGYENPMPVQEEVIPYLLGEDNDVVALAQTGTGKTAAFGLPILQKINTKKVYPQALVLSPTRELCLQIADDLKDYAKYIDGLSVLPVYGGSSIETQIRGLRRGVHIIVATPGRLLDLMNRGVADLSAVQNVILDEADEMLNMGFSESIDAILEAVPENRNTLLFSATMPDEIAKIARKYMREPHEITIGNRNESTASVRHLYYMVHAKDKYQTLKRIVDFYPNIYGIVFCRTKLETQEIADKLVHDGYSADALHGDLSQAQRDYVMQRFRVHNVKLLVATDVAARGIDVNDLTHVINYTLPDEVEAYTHRSGRTGRAGKTGISISIINLREKHKIRAIERIINKTFEACKMPTGKEICNKQIFNLMSRLEKVEVNEVEIADVLPSVYRKLDWLDKEDLIKRLVSLEFNRLIEYYQDNEDIETIEEKSGKKQEGGAAGKSQHITTEQGFSKIYIGMGKIDGLLPKNLLELLNANVEGRVEVGRIDLFRRYTLFDVDEKSGKKVLKALRSLRYLGRDVRVEFASEEQIMRAQREREEGSGGKLRAKRGRSREGTPRFENGAARSNERNTSRSAEHSVARSNDFRSGKGAGKAAGKSAGKFAGKAAYKDDFKDKKKSSKGKASKGKF